MKMVGHDDKGQGVGKSLILCLFELMYDLPAQAVIPENRLPLEGVGRQKVDAILFGMAADSKTV